MDNQEVSMDVEAQIVNNDDDQTLPFSIFKKANRPVTLKVWIGCFYLFLDTYSMNI